VVISWADEPQEALDLFIEPRRGLTCELLYHAQSVNTTNPVVLFTGPHGCSVTMDGYESILMVASGFGIAALQPYLKRLIHGYNARDVQARRIHLIWQIRDIGTIYTRIDSSNIADIS
jgi:NAD(P)H-flavin reductase